MLSKFPALSQFLFNFSRKISTHHRAVCHCGRLIYESDKTECVRTAEVDDQPKESRLQGLKDRLAAANGDGAAERRAEVKGLEGVSRS